MYHSFLCFVMSHTYLETAFPFNRKLSGFKNEFSLSEYRTLSHHVPGPSLCGGSGSSIDLFQAMVFYSLCSKASLATTEPLDSAKGLLGPRTQQSLGVQCKVLQGVWMRTH